MHFYTAIKPYDMYREYKFMFHCTLHEDLQGRTMSLRNNHIKEMNTPPESEVDI